MVNSVFSAVLASVVLDSVSFVSAATPCDYVLEDSIAIDIANDIDLLLSVSDESLPTFNDQLRLMGFTGSPGDKDDLTPPHQRVMFNSYLHSAHGNNYFTGYKDGEFLGYFPDEKVLRWRAAGAYDANVQQRTAYTFDPITGNSGSVVSSDVYDPRRRDWYQDAIAECTSDLLNSYTCQLHWTAPYVFASSGELGITPARGFLDHTTGLPLGVTGYGFHLSDISTLLSDAVQGKSSMVAYVMEGDGGLLAVSNSAPVTANGARVNARSSTDALISSSATLVIDSHFRSDQTLLVDGQLITVKSYQKDNHLHWYIVVVEHFDPANPGAEADCILAVETDMLAISRGEVDLLLTNSIEAGDLVVDAFRLGLMPYAPPAMVDAANGIQDYIFATIRNCDVIFMLYVGYEDGTFVGYHHDGGWSTFRGADGSGDTLRSYYYHDPVTGDKTGAAYRTSSYDPRTRPWYAHGKQLGSGSFGPIYTFSSTGSLGLTYSAPFYENGVFKGVVGVDFDLAAFTELLSGQSQPGFGVFLFENERTSGDDAYDMLATSNNAEVNNATHQHKAYDINTVQNYYIATISQNLRENSLVHDYNKIDLPDMSAEVLNYDERTLHWRFVAYNVKINEVEASSSASTPDEDDDMATVVGLAAACLALLVVVLAVVVAGLLLAKNRAAASEQKPLKSHDSSAL